MPMKDPVALAAAKRRSYEKHREKIRRSQQQARKRTRDYLWSVKEKAACIRCGLKNPIVIEFHHRDPGVKEITPANMVCDKWTAARIDKELEKCDTVCANCHRIIHYEWRQAGIESEEQGVAQPG